MTAPRILAAAIAAILGNSDSPGGPSLSFDFTTGTVVSTRGGGIVPTFTRATTKTQTDWEGRPSTALSGEVVFEGLRRVRNCLLTTSENFAAWSAIFGGTGTAPVVTAGQLAPDGTATAYRLQADKGAGGGGGDYSMLRNNMTGGITLAVARHSVWMKSNTGATQNVRVGGSGFNSAVAVTVAWQRFSTTQANQNTMDIGAQGGLGGDPALDILIWHASAEDLAGSSNQNPSEYVSVGVLATPFQGAKVDGVKYFDKVNGNTVTANVVTEATGATIPKITGVGIGWLPGSAGSYFSTPDSVANSITGDIDLRVYVAAKDWTPASESVLLSKWTNVGSQQAWSFQIQANGVPKLYLSTTGANILTWAASTGPTVTDGTGLWVRVTRSTSTGDGVFYTSQDGVTWTQLGTTIAGTGGAIFDSTAPIEIGTNQGGTVGPFALSGVYRAQIYNGIAGTLALDFTPTAWITGTTFTSSGTGEVWTLNGGAKVFKWGNGYYPEVLSTNLVLQSENTGVTWAAIATPTRTAAALKCGNIALDLLSDADAGTADGYSQTVTFTGNAVKAVSCYIAQGTSTSSVIQLNDTTAVADRLMAAVTWVNGIPTVTMTTGTLLGVFPKANGVWRVEMLTTAVTAANVNSLRLYPATTAALAVANTGNAYFGGVMAEDSTDRCSSYIPTTTATVSRNAELMTTPTGAWFNAAASSLVAKVVTGAGLGAAHWIASLNDATTTERSLIYQNTGGAGGCNVTDNNVIQANISAGAFPASTAGAIAAAITLNDVALILNGAVVGTDASATMPTPTQLSIAQDEAGTQQFNGLLCNLDYYPIRINNALLQQATT